MLAAANAHISDTHVGSTVALSTPTVLHTNGQTTSISFYQGWLLECWRDYYLWVKGIVDEGRKLNPAFHFTTTHAGDIVEGCHHGTRQLMSMVLRSQEDAAAELLDPLACLSDHLIFVDGTEVHDGNLGESAEGVVKALDCDHKLSFFDGAERVIPHARYKFDTRNLVKGVRFDVAHHVGITNIPAGRPGNAARELAMEYHTAAEAGEIIPDYLIRGHAHRRADTGFTYRARAIILPCWQLKTSFGHKVARAVPSDIGGGIVRIYDDGSSDFSFKLYPQVAEIRRYMTIRKTERKDDAQQDQKKPPQGRGIPPGYEYAGEVVGIKDGKFLVRWAAGHGSNAEAEAKKEEDIPVAAASDYTPVQQHGTDDPIAEGNSGAGRRGGRKRADGAGNRKGKQAVAGARADSAQRPDRKRSSRARSSHATAH